MPLILFLGLFGFFSSIYLSKKCFNCENLDNVNNHEDICSTPPPKYEDIN